MFQYDGFTLVRGQIDEQTRESVQTAAAYLSGRIKRKLSSADGPRTGKEYKIPGTNNRTYTASAPGEAPAVMLANLISSIDFKMVDTLNDKQIVAQVGTNIEYARRLEFGFIDTDALGRKYNMEPRPYFRSTYMEEKEKLIRIMGGESP